MEQPLLPWGSEESHPGVVWRSTLDGRYLIEVQRTGERKAKLCVFDHEKEDQVIFSRDVGLSYGAIFGPDVDDVASWQEEALDFIDNIYPKQQ